MNNQRYRRPFPASPAMPARYASPHRNEAEQKQSERQEEGQKCGFCLQEMPSPAMVYPSCSTFEDLLVPEAALKNGSLFRALLMPFAPDGGKGCGCGV